LALGLGGCAPSIEWDREVGAAYSTLIADEMGLVKDQQLTPYVKTMGQRLAGNIPERQFDYTFEIIDDETPNAFSLPGGYVYISRGLLVLTNTEDELANVLGHEVGHVEERHSARRYAAATVPGLLALPGAAVGAVAPGLGNAMTSPFRGMIASYSRDQEHAADRFAQEVAARAGFDPGGMSALLHSLGREEELQTGETRIPHFMDTHPPTPDRADATARRAASLTWTRSPETTIGRDEYLRRLDGLIVGANPAHGIIQDGRFLHPTLNCTVEIPRGWTAAHLRSSIAAVTPDGDAVLFGHRPEPGTDPHQAAETWLRAARAQIRMQVTRSEPRSISGFPGHAVTAVLGRRGDAIMEVIWLAYEGRIYQLIGMFVAERPALGNAIRQTAESFRPLTASERASIEVVRVRLATARAGESLQQVGERSGNTWSLEATAVMNGLSPGARLEEGLVVKVGVAERY
jgi:predicted Zn-dependent protease